MIRKKPKISVLLPVYNAERFLRQSIESILKQSFEDYEFLIIDDGSTDASAQIIKSYRDPRIRLLQNEKNRKLYGALNRGLDIAQGEYVARMDADDISLPHRLGRQAEFLDKHPDIGVVGTWAKCIDENDRVIGTACYPTRSNLLAWQLFYRSPLINTTIMMRYELVKKADFYRSFSCAEDYDLWSRLVEQTRFANMPDFLVHYRIWSKSLTQIHSKLLEKNDAKVKAVLVKAFLNQDVPMGTISSIQKIYFGAEFSNIRQVENVIDIIWRLYDKFSRKYSLDSYEIKEIDKDIAKKLYVLSFSAMKLSILKGLSIFACALKLNPLLLLVLCARRVYYRARQMQYYS
jgi:glycosyltransferase involved in cell wall biosynthesis